MILVSKNRVNLFAQVSGIAAETGSLFKLTLKGKDKLIDFMDANDWFGMNYRYVESEIYTDSLEPCLEQLKLWLQAYGRTAGEKNALMISFYERKLPETCERFQAYLADHDVNDKTACLVLDFVLFSAEKELCQYTEADIKDLIEAANRDLTLTCIKVLADFLRWPYKGTSLTGWNFQFITRQRVPMDQSAYPIRAFSVMAYTILNKESWEKQQLIEKAASSRIYADLWLFTSLHFVCALRRSDISRLPVPSLPYPKEELREKIRQGTLTDEEAKAIANEVVIRQRIKNRKPHKTGRYSVPELKLFFPESLLVPLGIIIGLALSHHSEGESFVSSNAELTQIRNFYGENFAVALGNRKFMSRRANKAYLQGIEAVADDSEDIVGKPKGYMLAALARSHKGGIGTLPEMTDIYLRDENFTGYSPEFILREMFERGIFGFIPVMLFESYMKSEFRALDVVSQTKLICEIGLSAEQIEKLSDTVMRSYVKAGQIVKDFIRSHDISRENLNGILQKVASGSSPSHQEGMLCLMTASGKACPYPSRSGCIGCGYEIYTKSAVHMLMKEYTALMKQIGNAHGPESQRLQNILQKGLLPAVLQVLESIPLLYPGAEMEPVYQIVERGMQHADRTQ